MNVIFVCYVMMLVLYLRNMWLISCIHVLPIYSLGALGRDDDIKEQHFVLCIPRTMLVRNHAWFIFPSRRIFSRLHCCFCGFLPRIFPMHKVLLLLISLQKGVAPYPGTFLGIFLLERCIMRALDVVNNTTVAMKVNLFLPNLRFINY